MEFDWVEFSFGLGAFELKDCLFMKHYDTHYNISIIYIIRRCGDRRGRTYLKSRAHSPIYQFL